MSSSDFSDIDEPPPAVAPSTTTTTTAPIATVAGNEITVYVAIAVPVPFDAPLEAPVAEYKYGGDHYPWVAIPVSMLSPPLQPDDLQGGLTCKPTGGAICINRSSQQSTTSSSSSKDSSILQLRLPNSNPQDIVEIDAIGDLEEQSSAAVGAWAGRESSPLLTPTGAAKLPLVAGASPFPLPKSKAVAFVQILPGNKVSDVVFSLIKFPRYDQLAQIAKRREEAEKERKVQEEKAAKDKEDRDKRLKEDQERRAQQEKDRKEREATQREEQERLKKEQADRDAAAAEETAKAEEITAAASPPPTPSKQRTSSAPTPNPTETATTTTTPTPQRPTEKPVVQPTPSTPPPAAARPAEQEWSRSAKPAAPLASPPKTKKAVAYEEGDLLEDEGDEEYGSRQRQRPPHQHLNNTTFSVYQSLPKLIISPEPKMISASAISPPQPFGPPPMVDSRFTRCGGTGMSLLSGGIVTATGQPSSAFYKYSNGRRVWEELQFSSGTGNGGGSNVCGFNARHGHSSCFSPVDHRVYIYGGMGHGGFDPVKEMQALRALSSQQKLKYFAEMSKGNSKNMGYLDDLWAVDTEDLTLTRIHIPETTTDTSSSSSDPNAPLREQTSYRYQHSSVMDALGNLVIIGGRTATFMAQIPDSKTQADDEDGKNKQVTIFEDDVSFTAEESCCDLRYLDVCNVILASTPEKLRPKKMRKDPLWRVVVATGDVPCARFGHSMDRARSGDPTGAHAYLFGGCCTEGALMGNTASSVSSNSITHLSDLYALNTESWVWTRVSLAATIPPNIAFQSPSVVTAIVAGRSCVVMMGTTTDAFQDPNQTRNSTGATSDDDDDERVYVDPKLRAYIVDLETGVCSKVRPIGLGGTGSVSSGRGPSTTVMSASTPLYGFTASVTSATSRTSHHYSGRLPCKSRVLLSLTLIGGQSSDVADVAFTAGCRVQAGGLVAATTEAYKGLGRGSTPSDSTSLHLAIREDTANQALQLSVSAQLKATRGWTVGRMAMLPGFVDPAAVASATTLNGASAPLDRNIVTASKPQEGWQIEKTVGRLSRLTDRQKASLMASHPEKFKEEIAQRKEKEAEKRRKDAISEEKMKEMADRLCDKEQMIRNKRKAAQQKEVDAQIDADVQKTAKRREGADDRDDDWWRHRFLNRPKSATQVDRPRASSRRLASNKEVDASNNQLYYTAVEKRNENMKKLEEQVLGVPKDVPKLSLEEVQRSVGRLYRGPPSPLSSHKGRPQTAGGRGRGGRGVHQRRLPFE